MIYRGRLFRSTMDDPNLPTRTNHGVSFVSSNSSKFTSMFTLPVEFNNVLYWNQLDWEHMEKGEYIIIVLFHKTISVNIIFEAVHSVKYDTGIIWTNPCFCCPEILRYVCITIHTKHIWYTYNFAWIAKVICICELQLLSLWLIYEELWPILHYITSW